MNDQEPINDERTTLARVYGDRIDKIAKKFGWSIHTFSTKSNVDPKTLARYRSASARITIPLHNAFKIARAAGTSIDWLLGRTDEFDTKQHSTVRPEIVTKAQYELARQSIIQNAQSELAFIWRTGETFDWAERDLLITTLERETFEKLKIYVGHPYDTGVMTQIAARRLDGEVRVLTKVRDLILDSMTRLIPIVESAAGKRPAVLKCPEVTFGRYSPSFVAHGADMDMDNGQILIILQNFQTNFYDAPMMRLYRSNPTHETLYEYYQREINNLLEPSSTNLMPALELNFSDEDILPITEKFDFEAIKALVVDKG